MNEDQKGEIAKINEFIEKHSLQKIMKIIYGSFGGLIALILVVNLMPTKYYDCSDQGTKVVDKVLACEQQKIDERIAVKQLDLEKYKVSENYKMDQLKTILKEVDFKKPEKLLTQAKTSTLEMLAIDESCVDKVVKTMCEVKFK